MRLTIPLIFVIVAALSPAATAAPAPTVAELRRLAGQGKHEQVVASADAAIAALPRAARMVARPEPISARVTSAAA